MRAVSVAVVLFAACGTSGDTSRAAESEPPLLPSKLAEQASPVTAKPRTRAPAPTTVTPPGWRWSDALREVQTGKPLVHQTQADRRFVLESGRDPDALSVRREDASNNELWKVTIKPDFVATGVLIAHGDWVIVVHHSSIASGATLLIFDASNGKQLHRKEVHGLGPVAHSKYRNQIQLEIRDSDLMIYGKESQGRYTEVYELGSWKRRSTTLVSASHGGVSWQWEGPTEPSHRNGPQTLPAGDFSFVFDPNGTKKTATVEKRSASGAIVWKAEIGDGGPCSTASMMQHETLLFVVDYCSATSGAQLTILDADSGTRRGQRSLDGLGSVEHSEYWNDVELRMVDGKLAIFGREAKGRYIEVVEPATGALIALQSFRD